MTKEVNQPGPNDRALGTNYYYSIPATVMFAKNLSANSKLLYGVIVAMAQKTGYCWASSKTIAEYYGCTREAISRQINDLKAKGFIRVEIVNGTTRKIYINGVTDKSQGCDGKITTPVTEESQGRDGKITQNKKTKLNNKNLNKKRITYYGEYKNVPLTDDELEKLKAEFPNDWEEWIERLSSYCQSTGKTYKDNVATIRNWARRDGETYGRSVKIKLFGQADGVQSKAQDFEKVIRAAEERRTAGAVGTMPVGEDSAGKSLRTPADRPWEQHKL